MSIVLNNVTPETVTAAMIKAGLREGQTIRVTIEPVELSDAEWEASVRAKVAEGLADVAAGRLVDGEEVFARLLKKYSDE
jgi:hypothetical protein